VSKQWKTWERRLELGTKQLLIMRVEPRYLNGIRIDGYLTSLPPTMELDDVRKAIRALHGGGGYNVLLVRDDGGDPIGSVRLEFSGPPKIPKMKCNCPLLRVMNQGCQLSWHE
jgi:hypothetical protein